MILEEVMKHIPNLLTIMRMLLIPFIPYMYIIHNNRFVSIILILFAAVSDFLDGYLARRFHLITEVGKVLDPLADKLLLIAIIFSLFYTSNFSALFLVAYLLIEITMIVLGVMLYTRKRRVVISSNAFGKIATGLFLVTAVLSIWYGYNGYVAVLFAITLLFKLIAFSSYIRHYFVTNTSRQR